MRRYATPSTLTDIRLICKVSHAQGTICVIAPFSLLSCGWPWPLSLQCNIPASLLFCNPHPKYSWLRRSVNWCKELQDKRKATRLCYIQDCAAGKGLAMQALPKLLLPFTGSSFSSVAFLDWDQAVVLRRICTCNFAVCKTVKLRRYLRLYFWCRESSRAYTNLLLTLGKADDSNIISTKKPILYGAVGHGGNQRTEGPQTVVAVQCHLIRSLCLAWIQGTQRMDGAWLVSILILSFCLCAQQQEEQDGKLGWSLENTFNQTFMKITKSSAHGDGLPGTPWWMHLQILLQNNFLLSPEHSKQIRFPLITSPVCGWGKMGPSAQMHLGGGQQRGQSWR